MRKHSILVLLVLLLMLSAVSVPTFAQDAEPAAVTEAIGEAPVEGASTLILLIGLGAIGAVGGLTLLRQSFYSSNQEAQ